jgi:hypothetical protein
MASNTRKSRRNPATRASLRRNAAAVTVATRDTAGTNATAVTRTIAVTRGIGDTATAANTATANNTAAVDTATTAEPTLGELDALAERAVKEIDAPPPGPRAQSANSPNPAVL